MTQVAFEGESSFGREEMDGKGLGFKGKCSDPQPQSDSPLC